MRFLERLEAFDLGTLYWFGSLHQPWLDRVVMFWTRLGNPLELTLITSAWVLLLALFRRWKPALLLAAIGLSSLALELGTKYVVMRPRPNVVWRLIPLPDQPSFPSGHAVCAMAIYLGGAMLMARLIESRRVAGLVVAAGALMGMTIGLSRVYLGVHYPLDVFAGWAAGLACAFLWNGLLDGRKKPAVNAGEVGAGHAAPAADAHSFTPAADAPGSPGEK